MRKKWIYFVAPPMIVLFIAIGGEVVQQLWNWLAPTLFGWRQITFWQGLGLLALCRILFGGFSGGGGPRFRSGSGAATVELAGADVVRVAANYLLAGSRVAGAVPDSVRRL